MKGLHFATFDDLCYPDDLLILCTDALAEYILQRKEAGDQPRWDDFWKLSDQQWRDAILAHREDRQIRIDDTTFVLLQIRGFAEGRQGEFVPGHRTRLTCAEGIASSSRCRNE